MLLNRFEWRVKGPTVKHRRKTQEVSDNTVRFVPGVGKWEVGSLGEVHLQVGPGVEVVVIMIQNKVHGHGSRKYHIQCIRSIITMFLL